MTIVTEEQRKLIGRLMGLDSKIAHRVEIPMTDKRVCKSFILGGCPHEMFAGTKIDIGKCPKMHIEKLKMEYEYRTKKKGEQFPDLEYEYYLELKKYIHKNNQDIEVALKRLEHTPSEKAKIAKVTSELDALDTKIGLMTQEIDCLVESGENLKSIEQSTKLQELCKKREELAEFAYNLAENVGQASQQRLQVCEVCGSYMSRLDSDRRLADHYIGKIHLGYVQMRLAFNELHAKYKQKRDNYTT